MVGGALELGDVVGGILAQNADARGRGLGGLARDGALQTPIAAVVGGGGSGDGLVGRVDSSGAV